jgi:hypothetical protein
MQTIRLPVIITQFDEPIGPITTWADGPTYEIGDNYFGYEHENYFWCVRWSDTKWWVKDSHEHTVPGTRNHWRLA